MSIICVTPGLNQAKKGEVAERLKAAVLKTVEGAIPPRVRIPASPPSISNARNTKTNK